jgi:hypothetical protein
MLMKNICAALIVASLTLVSGCGGGNGCLAAIAANSTSCPANVFIDATASDPVCLAAGGVAICRGDADAICYRCTGASFSDGCLIKNQTQTIECVHGCSSC